MQHHRLYSRRIIVVSQELGSGHIWIITLPLNLNFVLPIDLVLNPEEGHYRSHVGQDEVDALNKFKEARIVGAELLDLYEIDACN